MPSDEEKGGSKERKEKKKKSEWRHEERLFTCVRPFSLEVHCDIYIIL